jgi:PBSX family phage terminase large subunit
MYGVMQMIDIKGRIQSLKDRISKIKQGRGIDSKLQIFEFQPFSDKQKKVLTWWCDSSPVKDKDGIIADGAIRSGKTVSMSLSFVMWAMHRFKGQNFGMCGKTVGSFRRNVLFWLKLMLKSRGYKVRDRRSDNLVEISKNGVTNYFYIFGGKDEGSQDLVQGITLAGVFFDEVALMPESFVNQATGRCSVAGSKYWFNCNPDGPYHWFKTNWIDKATGFLGKKKTEDARRKAKADKKPDGLKELLYVHFTQEDNLSLSEEVKARYRNNYSGVFYKRYILGLWAMAEGIIYDMFDVDRHVKKVLDFARLLIDGGRYVSIDYGTQNAMVFLLWNKGIDKKWYCTREYYYSGRDKGKQKADSQYADDLEKWLEGTPVKAIIVDPSAASFITELNNRGYKTMKADNDVEDGIRLVSTLLNTEKIAFSQSCINTIKEFASYIWDPKAGDRGEDKPIKQHDHAMDAVRYFCYTILNNKTIKIRSKSAYGFH